MDEEMGLDDFGWNDDFPDFRPPRIGNDFRNNRYNNAYGNYSGGYGPPGGPPPPPLSLGFSPRPMYLWGRGFGPRGPPGGPPVRRTAHEDKAIRYLMRCGVAKENLKNLSKEFLQHIEPHYCGICGQHFDTFSMSRIHYISKNHQKIQKRWVSKKSEMHNEVPLRARDLYCELCDVQITSKVHAESHYSGKSHRAVVDGRKYPRNPMLLQPNMKARLEQLIRREKKHLKNFLVQDAEESVKKELKPIASELYCDICKTSVTCTEQMTMHLNGKRHLSKEKQHILMMMKGGIPGNDDENSRNETATAATEPKEDENSRNETATAATEPKEDENSRNETATAATEPKEDAETAGDEVNEIDNFDWGNGSGNWDEPTTE